MKKKKTFEFLEKEIKLYDSAYIKDSLHERNVYLSYNSFQELNISNNEKVLIEQKSINLCANAKYSKEVTKESKFIHINVEIGIIINSHLNSIINLKENV
jgi:hypothetical protein